MEDRILQVARHLGEFLGHKDRKAPAAPKEIHPSNAPHWTKETAHLYRLPIQNTDLVLAALAPGVPFSQALNLYRVLSKMGLGPVLLLADFLPSKARGVLVRMKIPHVLSTGAIYAPQLGVVYKKLPATDESEQEVREKLLPTAQKLAAARLMRVDFLERSSTLTDLQPLLARKGYEVSISTLSRAFQQLEHFGLIQVQGSGPQKRVNFLEREILWPRILEVEIETTAKKVIVPEIPAQKYPWVYSSDSALARLSDLNQPEDQTIAMSLSQFKIWSGGKILGNKTVKHESKVVVEVWRGDPVFLERERCLNPVELSISLRRSRDPRIQLAVSEILEREGLNPNLLWERE